MGLTMDIWGVSLKEAALRGGALAARVDVPSTIDDEHLGEKLEIFDNNNQP